MRLLDNSPHAIALLDGRREVAIARPQGGYGVRQWLVKLRAGCWVDGGAFSSITGKRTPEHRIVKTKRAARMELTMLMGKPQS